ncbi:MAG: cytochrome ubiquinol oxidase subunit I, partial [Polyangiaceae bacterium]|nr:cytochrome ubiquinol oxidase subunit I [Polyangiaceae bacterium]
ELLKLAMDTIDETAAQIYPSQVENFSVWPVMSERVTFQRSDAAKYDTYEKNVQYLKDFLTNRAGWMTAELGRQPWAVYGLLRTAEGASANVSAGDVVFSALGFMGLYALLGMLFVLLVLREVGRGPESPPPPAEARGHETPARPSRAEG